MYFAGWTASCLFVPRLSDIYGRKIPALISSVVSIPIYIGLILSRSITLSIILFFLLGLTCTGKASTAYVYLLEYIPKNRVTWVGSYMLFADGSTMIFSSIYFRYITNDWLAFQIYGVVVLSISTVAMLLIPESPKFLYSVKRYDEARVSLGKVARFNKSKKFKNMKFDTEEAEEQRIN